MHWYETQGFQPQATTGAGSRRNAELFGSISNFRQTLLNDWFPFDACGRIHLELNIQWHLLLPNCAAT